MINLNCWGKSQGEIDWVNLSPFFSIWRGLLIAFSGMCENGENGVRSCGVPQPFELIPRRFIYDLTAQKSEDGYSSKQAVFGSDGETTRYAARHGRTACLQGLRPSCSNSNRSQVLRYVQIANLFATNDKNLSHNKNHLWAGGSYCPEVILPE